MESPLVAPDRIAGCLIGQCLADALAAPARGNGADLCREYVQERVRPWLKGERLEALPNPLLFTDGSQLMCELAATPAGDPEMFERQFLASLTDLVQKRWVTQRYLETHLAAKAFAATGNPRQTGSPSVGLGSVHRAAAAALRHWKDREKLRSTAARQSGLTHRNPLCDAVSALFADLVGGALRGELGSDRLHFDVVISDSAPALGEAMRQLPELLQLEPPAALAQILAWASEGRPETEIDELPDRVLCGLLWSLYCAIRSQWRFADAVCLAITAGGEVVGPTAMVGALCGAHCGAASLPRSLAERLTDRGMPVYAKLLDLAKRCFEASLT